MNKYESALKRIELYIKPWEIKIDNCGREISNEVKEINLNLLKELVDKATPCKFVKSYSQHGTETWLCPNCRRKLKRAWQFDNHYCPKCGQAIDWGE